MFAIELSMEKMMSNFLATGFDFVYAISALYFSKYHCVTPTKEIEQKLPRRPSTLTKFSLLFTFNLCNFFKKKLNILSAH